MEKQIVTNEIIQINALIIFLKITSTFYMLHAKINAIKIFEYVTKFDQFFFWVCFNDYEYN
jgi:hypothetical protein